MSEKPGAERAPLHGLVQRWAPHFRAYDAAEPVAAGFRARQLQAVLRLTPLTMLANLLNVLIVAAAFWPVGPRPFLVGWCLAIILVAAWGTRVWWRSRRGPPWRTASPQALQRATRSAALLALLWALMPLVLFPGADGERQLLVATITTGMMCAGGFALATTPAAGTAYVLILGGRRRRRVVPGRLPAGLAGGRAAAAVRADRRGQRLVDGAPVRRPADGRGRGRAPERGHRPAAARLRGKRQRRAVGDRRRRPAVPHLASGWWRCWGCRRRSCPAVSVVDVLQRLLPEGDAAAGQLAAIRHHLDAGSAFRDLPLATAARPAAPAGGR